jgi:FecR protein
VPRITSRMALLTLGIVVSSSPAFADAEKVGVAAEVNPDVTGQPPNEPLSELLIGHNIIRNEKIATQDAGQAQLLFTDQSTLTVAKNSEVVIDEFVFDPKKQVGNLTASLTTGLFRYVGGKISKEKDITFYTPTGTVSVRGGIALIKVHGNTLQAIFVFGERMTVSINGQTQTATLPNTVIFTTDGRPSSPAPASVEMLESLNREMESSNNQTLTIGNEFAAEVPDLPPDELLRARTPQLSGTAAAFANFLSTPTPRLNPTIPTLSSAATPTSTPTSTLAQTSSLVTTTPTQTSTQTSGSPPPPATTPTPPPAPTPTPTPAPHDHHRVDRDHDHDHDFKDRHDHHRHWAERDLDDRDSHHGRDQYHDDRLRDDDRSNRRHPIDGRTWTEPTTRHDLEHSARSDDSGDGPERWPGEDRDHGSDKNLEGHSSFDRYVVSDDHSRDDHSGENHGFDRRPTAGGPAASWRESGGDPSHRFGRPDRYRWTDELLAFEHFRDAIRSSWGRQMPYWANGGRGDEHHHADRHHLSPHR